MIGTIRYLTISVLLSSWAFVMSFVCATLMIGHWVPLPTPQVGTQHDIASRKSNDDSSGWRAFHILSNDCPCSKRILKHLLKREPLTSVDEVIVCVGEIDESRELSQVYSYEFDWVTPDTLRSKYNVESAPLLIVLDKDNTVRYSGAYTSSKQGFEIQDVSIMTRIRNGESVKPLLVYGCGASKELSALTDPLALKKGFYSVKFRSREDDDE